MNPLLSWGQRKGRGRRERWARGENRKGVGVDLLGLRQTADRLSQAALILHSRASSWSPPVACPLSPATCFSENNKLRHQRARRDLTQSKEARQVSTDRSLVPSFWHPIPSDRVLREDWLRTGRTWRPEFVVVTRRGALSEHSRCLYSSL